MHLYFRMKGLSPHEKKILSLLKAGESTPSDKLVEKLERQVSSSVTFRRMVRTGLGAKVRQMPGKRFVKALSGKLRGVSLVLGARPKWRLENEGIQGARGLAQGTRGDFVAP